MERNTDTRDSLLASPLAAQSHTLGQIKLELVCVILSRPGYSYTLGGTDLFIHSLYEGLLTHRNPGDNPVLRANNPDTETICEPRIT